MTTMSDRVSVTYTGEDALEVFAGANPNPSIVTHGDDVEVDEWAATSLLNSGGPWRAVGAAPDGVLTGKALTAALAAEGLPTTGTAAEKRARLLEHEQAQQLATQQDPEADLPADATDEQDTETDA